MTEEAINQHIAIFLCLGCIWMTLVWLGLSLFLVNRHEDDDKDLHP